MRACRILRWNEIPHDLQHRDSSTISRVHLQIQMDWFYLAFGFALLLLGGFVPRKVNESAKGR